MYVIVTGVSNAIFIALIGLSLFSFFSGQRSALKKLLPALGITIIFSFLIKLSIQGPFLLLFPIVLIFGLFLILAPRYFGEHFKDRAFNILNTCLVTIFFLSCSLSYMWESLYRSNAGLLDEMLAYLNKLLNFQINNMENAARLLMPSIWKSFSLVLQSEAAGALVARSFIFFICLTPFFFLGLELTKSHGKALIGTFLMALFSAVMFGTSGQWAGPFLYGVMAAQVFSVITRKNALFLFVTLIGSFERAEIAVLMCGFKVLWDWFDSGKKIPALKNLSVASVGAVMALVIPRILVRISGASESTYSYKWSRWDCTLLECAKEGNWQVKLIGGLIVLILPLLGANLIGKKFNFVPKLIFFCLLPHMVLFAVLGDFSEPRGFLPLMGVLILNIIMNLPDFKVQVTKEAS